MAKGLKTGGRVAGTPNKLTTDVRQALQQAFDEMGGVPALVSWGASNPSEFYRLWAKLLPKELNIQESPKGRIVVYLPDDGRDQELSERIRNSESGSIES
jgi:hypothetical protein